METKVKSYREELARRVSRMTDKQFFDYCHEMPCPYDNEDNEMYIKVRTLVDIYENSRNERNLERLVRYLTTWFGSFGQKSMNLVNERLGIKTKKELKKWEILELVKLMK